MSSSWQATKFFIKEEERHQITGWISISNVARHCGSMSLMCSLEVRTSSFNLVRRRFHHALADTFKTRTSVPSRPPRLALAAETPQQVGLNVGQYFHLRRRNICCCDIRSDNRADNDNVGTNNTSSTKYTVCTSSV